MNTRLKEICQSIVAGVGVIAVVGLVTVAITDHTEVGANSEHRVSSESKLSDIHEAVIRMEERQKAIQDRLEVSGHK